MKFVSLNIQYGFGQDGILDLDRTVDMVRGADVIALQEVERFWKRTGMTDQPLEIANRLPDYYWVFGANLDMDRSFRDENGRLVNRRKQFGNMLLCKTVLQSTRNFPLPKYGSLSQHSIQHGLLEAVVDTPSNGPLRIYTTHLSHLATQTRIPEVERLMDIYRRAPGEGGAWCGGHPDPDAGWLEEEEPPMPHSAVLMGDFNFIYSEPEYVLMVGPLSPEFGRLPERGGLLDGWVEAGEKEDQGVTDKGEERVDYCFVSEDMRGKVRSAYIDADVIGSDHQPMWVEIDL